MQSSEQDVPKRQKKLVRFGEEEIETKGYELIDG